MHTILQLVYHEVFVIQRADALMIQDIKHHADAITQIRRSGEGGEHREQGI